MQEHYEEFLNEVNVTAEVESLLKAEAFFRLYSNAGVESGDIEDPEPCHVLYNGSPAYRIDGYYLNSDQGELGLIVCDFKSDAELKSMNSAECNKLLNKVVRFYTLSMRQDFIAGLENESPAFQAAFLLHESMSLIKRVRVIIMTNSRLSIRKAGLTTKTIGDINFTCSVLDFQRYSDIISSRSGVDPIEIDLREHGLSPLPCLTASCNDSGYASYLVVIPAPVLAEFYSLYGARLLEANVRTYLQARTLVNKGMQNSLKNEPQNFFAYNNGLTATSSSVTVEYIDNAPYITYLKDLQIVNGGQTTASILYARDNQKVDIQNVFVQMKLSSVDEDIRNELIPSISRFSNTQNKVSAADFFANHPFHVQIEQLSRRIFAPIKEGDLVATKWFYERARGQYRDLQAYKSPSERRKLSTEFPKSQMLVKTDLAKYELTFQQQPHLVCLGAQKCFMKYAEHIEKTWTPDALNFGDGFFKDAMARSIIFRWTDRMIAASEWYAADRAYKSQTVTYTLSYLCFAASNKDKTLDYRRIWNKQELPAKLKKYIENIAIGVAAYIRNTPDNVRNVAEYCKKQICWSAMSRELMVHDSLDIPSDIFVDKTQYAQRKRDDKAVSKIDSEINSQKAVFEKGAEYWKSARVFAQKSECGTPKELGVLDVCTSIPARIPTEKQSVVALKFLATLESEGFVNDQNQ